MNAHSNQPPTPPAPPAPAAPQPYVYVAPPEPAFAVATGNRRFVNHLIDSALIYIVYFAFMYVNDTHAVFGEKFEMVAGLLMIFGYPLYVLICESIWQRSIGKLITKTKVVDMQGNRPHFWKVLGRTAARFIPLEPLSFLKKYPIGWHDSLSGTMVVPSNYTSENVRSINPEELKKTSSNTALAVVVTVIFGIAIIGIISSVVLASLTTAREKGRQATSGQTSLGADSGTYENNIFTVPEKDMSAFFPLKPRLEGNEAEVMEGSDVTYRYVSYMATQKRNDYMLGKYDYSEPIDAEPFLGAEELLTGFMDDLISSVPEGKRISHAYSLKNGQPTLDFKFAYEASGVEGKFAIENGNIYMGIADYREGTAERATIDKFLESIMFYKQ